ncbi:MAG: 6-bladed beta-propeller, partial [Gemmatimonadota bacterium]|nr:6-bladed beta-propeller [Gemmatimonadota bacterium]
MKHPPIPLAFVATLALGVGSASGQAIPMESPDAVFAESFSVIQTVRELPDGRVLVADPLGQALVVIDFERQAGDTLGRVGQGPAEYRQPDAV